MFQSISPTTKDQPSKANIVADTWSRSQRSTSGTSDKDQRSDEAKAQRLYEDEIYQLTAVIMKKKSSEMMEWTFASQQEEKLKTAM